MIESLSIDFYWILKHGLEFLFGYFVINSSARLTEKYFNKTFPEYTYDGDLIKELPRIKEFFSFLPYLLEEGLTGILVLFVLVFIRMPLNFIFNAFILIFILASITSIYTIRKLYKDRQKKISDFKKQILS